MGLPTQTVIRQRNILKMFSSGFSPKQIAERLETSHRSAYNFLSRSDVTELDRGLPLRVYEANPNPPSYISYTELCRDDIYRGIIDFEAENDRGPTRRELVRHLKGHRYRGLHTGISYLLREGAIKTRVVDK